MAEGEAAGGVVERLRVGQGERRQARRAAQVDERDRRLGAADRLATGVVAERADVAVRREPPIATEPGSAPAEPGEPEPLESLDERPQIVEPERLRGAGDEVLTHRAR